MISSTEPRLHISNFTDSHVTIPLGKLLGQARYPTTWLDKRSALTENDRQRNEAYASLVRSLEQAQVIPVHFLKLVLRHSEMRLNRMIL